MRNTTRWTRVIVGVLALSALFGCKADRDQTADSISTYRQRMIVAADEYSDAGVAYEGAPTGEPNAVRPMLEPVDPADGLTTRESLLVEPMATTQPTAEDILSELPDPSEAAEAFKRRLDMVAEQTIEPRVVESYRQVVDKALEYLKQVERPQQVRLTLRDCIRRALVHNYAIRVQSYNPAIEGTRLVEAEAAFDAEFYLDASAAHSDQPAIIFSGNEQSDGKRIEAGVRKLLPTGMAAQISSSWQRTYIDNERLPDRTNPTHNTDLIMSVTQPLLRNFGTQVNRAQIEISRANRKVSYWRFVQEVRDQLLEVERAYWSLLQARRTAAILAESVAQNHVTYTDIWERRFHDATPVEINNSKSRRDSRYVDYLDAVKSVRDAEDALKNLLNDPSLKLSDDIEIIPVDPPVATPIAVDHFAEVRRALDVRSEIRQAKQTIEATRVQTAAAKNQTLPQLDVNFEYQIDGIGWSGDNAFDQLKQNRFQSYAISVNFSYPLGNRARSAAWRRARLQESQAIASLQQITDFVVQEINNVIRTIVVRYTQLPPQLEAVRSSERNLRSLQARTSAISPSFLETELTAVENLATNRSRLLSVLVEYNVAIVELERAKGTLLEYNNVKLADKPD